LADFIRTHKEILLYQVAQKKEMVHRPVTSVLRKKQKKKKIQQKIFHRFDAVLIQKEILKNKKSRFFAFSFFLFLRKKELLQMA
jgi:hypothetical protein